MPNLSYAHGASAVPLLGEPSARTCAEPWNGSATATRSSCDAAGWMHTGDLAAMDDADYGRIVGRIKDVIIRGGERVSA